MVNKRCIENLIPAKPGEIRNPKGRPKGSKNFMTQFHEAILSDEPWKAKSIKKFKSKVAKGDPAFWRMFFDQIGPEASAQAAKALGVTVNVSQQQAQAVNLPPPDISATDRMIELARLFASIPALPVVQGVPHVELSSNCESAGN
jgi:hypothetical protein